jgi:group II intron reverse transcriptase/maturase
MQKKLSRWATEDPAKRFVDLYSLLCNETWLRVAAANTLKNKGSQTAGIDGMTKSRFLEDYDGHIAQLQEALKTKTFEPMPVRRVYIPKPHSAKKRPLGIPRLLDRMVQEALRMILEPIWEADFSIHSYGFRPNRSTYDAISYIGNRLTGVPGAGYQWIIEGDLASYYDTIPQRRLIKAIKKRVADRDIRNLLWKFLRAGVMSNGTVTATVTGTPQGGTISPLLANIYLHELDRYMESKYLTLTARARAKRRRQGQSNFLYCRYADDWIVLCNGTKEQAYTMKEELAELLKSMGLTLSEDKTKVTHITEGFTFLGYRIRRGMGTSGKMAPRVEIPAKAMQKFRHKTREILAPSTSKEAVVAKITAMNQLIRGWCNYYRCTHIPSRSFDKLKNAIYWDMAHWLGRKYKISIPEVLRRYKEGQTFKTARTKLIMPSEYKRQVLRTKIWHNPYTAKDAIRREAFFSYENVWNGKQDDRLGWADLREEVIIAKGTTCYVCGTSLHPYEVEIDHETPRKRFKNPTEADRMKHLHPICTSCHRAKTKIDRKVLSRVR